MRWTAATEQCPSRTATANEGCATEGGEGPPSPKGRTRPGSGRTWPRVVPLALRALAAGVLLVFAGLLVPTGQVQAQTATTLVSNLTQGNDTVTFFSDPTDVAQQFTTGSVAGGYTLTGVDVDSESSHSFSVSVCGVDNDGYPTTTCTNLTSPGSFAAGVLSFTAPSNTMLTANTKYAVVMDFGAGIRPVLDATTSNGEDAGKATGWSIADVSFFMSGGSWLTIGGDAELRIAIKGHVGAPTLSDDATLSNLELEDSATDDSVSLNETFASGTTSYTATVEHHIAQLTVTPTTNDNGAAVEFLTGADADLDDADDDTAGHQVDLEPGANTFKVKVTSSDETEDETYTVTVTRLTYTTLVKNTHLSITSAEGFGAVQSGNEGQRFATGGNASGYQLVSLGIHINESAFSGSETATVRIHEFDEAATNDLGMLVATLETPTLADDAVNFFTTTSDVTLKPSTRYIINFHNTGNHPDDLKINVTSDTGQTGQTGWRIEDGRRLSGEVYPDDPPLMFEIRGTVNPKISIAVSDVETVEGPGATLDFVITITPAPRTSIPLSVSTDEVSASVGSDYEAISRMIDYPAGAESQTFSVQVFDDGEDEDDETLKLKLEHSPGLINLEFARSTGVGTIRDDDSLTNIQLADHNGDAVALQPAFDPQTKDYSVSLDSDVDQLTITPTLAAKDAAAGATIRYLDEDDNAIADADNVETGQQVNLDQGSNPITIQITTSGVATTYTLDAQRGEAGVISTTLVKNTHLTKTNQLRAADSIDGAIGQRFTTGTHSNGYQLNSVGIYVDAVDQADITSASVRIHEFDESKTNDLGTLVATLATPELVEDEVNYFEAPPSTTLDAQTEYIVNFDIEATFLYSLVLGLASGDDQMGAAGWLIEDSFRQLGELHSINESIMIEVLGTIARRTDDATLSNLELEDSATEVAGRLNETFAPDTTIYTATVENPVTQLTVTPTTSDGGASVEFLTGANADLDDADGGTPGHQVDLEPGANTFKVKVISSDRTEEETYSVTVTRLVSTTLVSNTHLSTTRFITIGHLEDGFSGQRFTTGSHTAGYGLTSVGILVESAYFTGDETVTVRVHEWDDAATNDLGDLVATLQTPALAGSNRVHYFIAPAGITLDPDTRYIVNFHSTGNTSSDLSLQVVSSNVETGASGWLIENTRRSGGSTSSDHSIMIEVRGNPLVIIHTNRAPQFLEGAATTRQIEEHEGGPILLAADESPFPYPEARTVGHWVRASDPDHGDRLFYFLAEGDGGKFQVYPETGQIRTKQWGQYILGDQGEAAGFIDYETQSSYRLKLRVNDEYGGQDFIDVTVEITDVAEPPLAPSSPRFTPEPGSLTSLNVGWTAPDNTGRPAITGYDVRYREAGETDWIDGPQDVSGTSVIIPGLDMVTSYEAQVRATNSDGISPWSNTGKGTTPTPTTPTLWFEESSYGVSEGGSVTVKVNLSPTTSREFTVPLNVTNRNGASSADYSGVPASLTFPAGYRSRTFTVTATEDAFDDRENLLVQLGNLPSGVNGGTPASTAVWISEVSTWHLWFTEWSYTATEGGDPATVTLGLSHPWRGDEALTLPLWPAGPQGGATAEDFSGYPESVTFAPGATEASFTVTATDDSAEEYGEWVQVSLADDFPDGLELERGPWRSRVNLRDNDGVTLVKVSFEEEAYRAVEGGRKAEVKVKLDQAPGRHVRIPLTTHYSNYGMRSADYSGVPNSVAFGPTETEKSFTVTAVNDFDRDVYDTLEIRFGDLPKGVSRQGPSTVVHLNDSRQVPSVSLQFSRPTHAIEEGVHNTYPYVRANPKPDARLVIPLTVERLGGATSKDYKVPARVVIDPEKDDHQGFFIEVLEDADIDPGESLRITFGLLPKGARLETGRPTSITVAMLDNEGQPRLSVTDAVATEGTDTHLEFVATLSPASTKAVTVEYRTEDGTAVSGSDYTTTDGTLTFDPGEKMKTISVPVIDDLVEDDGETMSLILSNAAGATIHRPAGTGTIRNTEVTTPGPRLRVNDPEATEGSDATLDFVVTLSPAATGTVTVAYATSDGTATAGSDYTADSGTLTFAAGETTRTISIAIEDDGVAEGDGETVNLTLSNASGAEIDYGDGLGRIKDAPESADTPGGTENADTSGGTDTQEESSEPFTMEFQREPSSHDGSTIFALRLKFTEEIAAGTKSKLRKALSVTGADMRLGLRVNDRLDLFEFRFEPTGNDDVVISLGPSTTDCTANNAVCTGSGKALTGTATVTIPGPSDQSDDADSDQSGSAESDSEEETPAALTAEFSDAPESHDGSTEFTVKLSFSEDVSGLSYETLRDHAFDTVGGDVRRASRVTPGSNQEWTITIAPSGDGDVTITLPETTNCNATGAVCNEDGVAFSEEISATIAGPNQEADADSNPDSNPDAEEETPVTLTAEFKSEPASHDGSTAFTLRLQFTLDLAPGTKKQLRQAISRSGADMKLGVRVDDRMDLFEFTFKPTGTDDVTISLGPSDTDCTAKDAVCTSDGTALTGAASVTIPYEAS